MTIKITVDEPVPQEQTQTLQKPQEPSFTMNFKLRKALDGSLMVFDHDHIDIIIVPQKMKIITFTKNGQYSDSEYAAQNRFFEFMKDKGMISPESIRGGNVYGSIEGKILKPTMEIPVDQIILLNVGKWLEEEAPRIHFDQQYKEMQEEYYTEPSEEDSTELGEVPQEEEKGSIPKYQSRRYLGGWG